MRILLVSVSILILCYLKQMESNKPDLNDNPIEEKKILQRKKLKKFSLLILHYFFQYYIIIFLIELITTTAKVLGYSIDLEFEIREKIANIGALIILLCIQKRIYNVDEE